MLHVNMIMLHVDINNLHINIILFHVDINLYCLSEAEVCHHTISEFVATSIINILSLQCILSGLSSEMVQGTLIFKWILGNN